MNNIRIATAQFEHRNGDKAYNLSVIDSISKKAAAEGALCHLGHRQPAASLDGAVQDSQQAQHGGRGLQGRGRRHS